MPHLPHTKLKTPVFGDLNSLGSSHIVIARPGFIYLANYNALSGAFSIIHRFPFPGNPSWLLLDSKKHHLYAVDEADTKLHRFTFKPDAQPPFTEHITTEASAGLTHLAFNASETRLVAAAFSGGCVDVFNIENGAFSQLKSVPVGGTPGPLSHIQDAPHPHQVVPDPSGRFYIVPDLGTDDVLVLDSNDDAFTISNRVSLPPGSGPRHGGFYPIGAAVPTHYFLLCELTNSVVVFSLTYTESTIQFTPVSSSSTFGSAESPSTARAGAFVISPENENVYVTNRLTGRQADGVVHMRIQKTDSGHPALQYVGEILTGGALPRHFAIVNDRIRDLAVVNEVGEYALVVLARGSSTGELTNEPKRSVSMAEFMSAQELKNGSPDGPKFIMQI